MSRQWSGSCAWPCQTSATPTPPVKPTLPSTTSNSSGGGTKALTVPAMLIVALGFSAWPKVTLPKPVLPAPAKLALLIGSALTTREPTLNALRRFSSSTVTGNCRMPSYERAPAVI